MSTHRVQANLSRVAAGANVDLTVALEGADDPDVIAIACKLVEPMAGDFAVESCEPDPYRLHHVRVRLVALERCRGGAQGLLLMVKREDDVGPDDDDDDDADDADDDDDDADDDDADEVDDDADEVDDDADEVDDEEEEG